MKGVALAGGFGLWLRLSTRVSDKHWHSVISRPMIFYPTQTLEDAGIQGMIVVAGG